MSGTVGVSAAEAVAKAAGRTVARVETFVVEAGWRNFLIVKATTSDGVVGWGDGTLGWKEFAVEALVKEFAERYLIGRDPFRIEDLWFKLYQIEHNTGPVTYAAMSEIETALWDIVRKPSGQPVYNLVGGKVGSKVRSTRMVGTTTTATWKNWRRLNPGPSHNGLFRWGILQLHCISCASIITFLLFCHFERSEKSRTCLQLLEISRRFAPRNDNLSSCR